MRRKVEKEDIIQKGLEIMMVKGTEGTGVKEIADATGILKGSFYNYFESKEEFIKALVETYTQNVLNFTKSQLLADASLSPINRLKRLFKTYWDSIRQKEGSIPGCFLGNCSQEVGNTNAHLGAAINKGMLEHVHILEELLKEAQKKNEIKSDFNSKMLAEFIYNSWQGMLVRAKSSNNNYAFNSFMKLVFEKLLV